MHLKECHQERKRRFRSLIFIHTLWMKPVSASACGRIVKRRLQIVLAQKPPESPPRFLKPPTLFRQPAYLQASRNRSASLHWLLIEARLLTTLGKKSAGANGHKNLLVVPVLRRHQPFQRLHPGINHAAVIAAPSCQDERPLDARD